MAEIVRELPGVGAACWVVRLPGGRCFRVSTVDVQKYGGGSGVQTLAYPCDEGGRVTEWTPAAGGWMDRDEVIGELSAQPG